MPSLENLKKQAKRVLRRHRDRYHPVAAQIRHALPRFRDLSDADILALHFRLADAQEVVAREHGFDGWTGLIQGVAAMPTTSKAEIARPVIATAEPQLFVRDIDAACAFYRTRLGFEIVFVYGEPPFYAQVRRDGARLNLRHVAASAIDPDLCRREDLLSASLTLASAEELKALFLEFQQAGVEFHHTLRREPWGASDFIALDADGNLLLFAAPSA